MGDRLRPLAAEALGSALLLATVVGSGIMAESLAGGNTVIALLGNTLPTAAILVVLITMFGPISGAHFNPAVSVIFALRGDLGWRHVPAYALAQIVGAIAGVWLAHVMFDLEIIQASTKIRFGAGQWIAEAVATFGLVITILGTLRARPDAIPVAVGLYITAAYWFTASTAFANPAVTIARAFTDTFAGIRPLDMPLFVVVQFCGAIGGLWVARWLFTPNPEKAAS